MLLASLACGALAIAIEARASPLAGLSLTFWLAVAPLAAAITPLRISDLWRRRTVALAGIAALLLAGALSVHLRAGGGSLVVAISVVGLVVVGASFWLMWAHAEDDWQDLAVVSWSVASLFAMDAPLPASLGLSQTGGAEEVRRECDAARERLAHAVVRWRQAAKDITESDFRRLALAAIEGSALFQRLATTAGPDPNRKHYLHNEVEITLSGLLDVYRDALTSASDSPAPMSADQLNAVKRPSCRTVPGSSWEPRVTEAIRALVELKAELARREKESKGMFLLTLPVLEIFGKATRAMRAGGPSLAIVWFFFLWVGILILAWTIDPTAWKGIGRESTQFGNFVYLAVGSAFGGPPAGIEPNSAAARMLAAAETLSGAILIGSYLVNIWRGPPNASDRPSQG
jgi:hypothetical protein